ncbi:MAG: hypothetical protein CMB49_03500 [Euryarchaeota archaeon]|nr:hypothetical protein [Euryarchaeota archaeon]
MASNRGFPNIWKTNNPAVMKISTAKDIQMLIWLSKVNHKNQIARIHNQIDNLRDRRFSRELARPESKIIVDSDSSINPFSNPQR